MELIQIFKKLFKIGMFNPKNYGYFGERVGVSSDTIITKPSNVFLYGNNSIKKSVVLSNSGKFIMKKNSFASYGLRVSTGNHERIVGIPCIMVKQDMKTSPSKDVVVEEDVWMGFNVTLVSGVTIGRGGTIAAGAVVTKSTPPYSVNGGVPCKFIKFYWTIDQILEHESKLYPEEERFTREQLEDIFEKCMSEHK